jgi:hypothetical protein
MSARACTRCGCTDASACPGGCAWMPVPLVDVCTACATPAELDARDEKLFAPNKPPPLPEPLTHAPHAIHRHPRQGRRRGGA